MTTRSSTTRYDQLRFSVGLTAVLIAIAFSILAAGDNVLPGDVAVARFFQRLPESPGRDLADLGNWIGSARLCAVLTFVLGLGLLAIRRWWEAALLVSALAVRASNGLFKSVLESPRPTSDLIRVTELADHFGFPSGHAMGSTLSYGAISFIAHRMVERAAIRRSVEVICVTIMLWIGFSRVYVGAHWPSDVLGGYLWGLILLSGLTFILSFLRHRLARRQPTDRQSPPVY